MIPCLDSEVSLAERYVQINKYTSVVNIYIYIYIYIYIWRHKERIIIIKFFDFKQNGIFKICTINT